MSFAPDSGPSAEEVPADSRRMKPPLRDWTRADVRKLARHRSVSEQRRLIAHVGPLKQKHLKKLSSNMEMNIVNYGKI